MPEVIANNAWRPISLQKRYRIMDAHLKLMKEHSLRNLQLPYVLDSDELSALHKVIQEPLFLLGRSGSGKTSVQTHALYYVHKAPMAWFEDQGGKAGPVMLVTRPPPALHLFFYFFGGGGGGGGGGEVVHIQCAHYHYPAEPARSPCAF